MNAVTTIRPELAQVQCPDLLRSLPGWLIWRYEHVDGEPKPRKVPYYTSGSKRHGVQGRPEDRQQLTTFDAARTAAMRRGYDGVGFCPMPEWNITALDFDNCIRDGGLDPDVESVVAGTYAEWSPSGQGVRAIVRGNLGNRKDHGEPFGFETFASKGFVTFTGNALPITELTDSINTIAEVTPEILRLCELRFGRAQAAEAGVSDTAPIGLSSDQLRDALDVLDPSMGHDPWLRVGMALHHETAGDGFELWDDWSARGAQYPGRDVLEKRWDSFGRSTGRPTTVHALVRMANEAGAHIDLAEAEAADDFEVIEAPPAVDKAGGRFAVVPVSEFAQRAPPAWLVRNVLPQAALAVLFGESTAGKTFMALDLAAAVARGVEWRGQRTKQGRVVYVAAEGGGGFRNRLKAYAQHHDLQLADLPLGVIHAAPNLLLKDDALEVCREIIAAGGADLVIVDTFAQVTPGANENAAEDVGRALAHCRGIHVATGALVLLVHHAGKDASRGARGWSGLKAAADAEIEVQRLITGRVIRVSKQKDGEDGLAWGFDLDVVPVGMDDEGDVITSCIVREAELPAVQQVAAAAKGLGKLQRRVVAIINEMAEAQTDGIEVEAVVTQVVERGGKTGERNARSHARRALNELCEREDMPYVIEDGILRIE
jgi:hypothetical protein